MTRLFLISIFFKNFNFFLSKFQLFKKIWFLSKFWFLSKISMFAKNFDFSRKFQFFSKISIFLENFNFFSKIFRKFSIEMNFTCTIMVSTLSGENLSLYRDSEWARPKAMADLSDSWMPVISERCSRIPRVNSWIAGEWIHSSPKLSRIIAPNFVSATASVSWT